MSPAGASATAAAVTVAAWSHRLSRPAPTLSGPTSCPSRCTPTCSPVATRPSRLTSRSSGLRDGRAFQHRSVRGYQGERLLVTASVATVVPQAGDDWQREPSHGHPRTRGGEQLGRIPPRRRVRGGTARRPHPRRDGGAVAPAVGAQSRRAAEQTPGSTPPPSPTSRTSGSTAWSATSTPTGLVPRCTA